MPYNTRVHRFNAYYISAQPSFIDQPDKTIFPDAVGAFFGALFAFMFGVIAFYLQKKFERYWKHKNTVVEIEHFLDEHMDQSAANQFLLQGAIDTLQRKNLTYTLLSDLNIPADITLRVGDIELLNEYFNYRGDILRVNHSMTSWQGLNEMLHQNVINNVNFTPLVIHKNMEILRDQATHLLKFMKALDEDTERLVAYTRIFLRKDRHIWSLWYLKKMKRLKPLISEEEIKQELIVLKNEVEEISRKSRQRIEQIQNG